MFFELDIRTSLDGRVALVKDNLTNSVPFDINAINILSHDSSLAPWTLTKEMAALAGLAGAISYRHKRQLAYEHGQAGWHAHAFPLSVDSLELVASGRGSTP